MTTFEMNNAIDTAFSKVELVACYVRCSTQEQKLHGLSIPAQKNLLSSFAEKNNMRIVEWYIDEGVSGRKLIKNRPELQRMMHDAQKGMFTRILMIKIDRFFRSVAEYHEFMKKIAPVVWTATEEDYDLTTANGRMLVNMKLTIAELEADQTGERIRIVNDYKVQTGQPLWGKPALPFGFKVGVDTATGRKNVIRDENEEAVVYDLIEHFLTHQSKRKTMSYIQAKYNIKFSYNSMTRLLKNTMLYGMYRDNPAYCEAYIDKETFDKIQMFLSRNVKKNTAENRVYLFSSLIPCPVCGRKMKGTICTQKQHGKTYYYKKYRCSGHRRDVDCSNRTAISEKVIERQLLRNIEDYLKDAKLNSFKVSKNAVSVPTVNIDDLYAELDRLNYSWKTGKIRTVEQYEKDYDELMKRIELAQTEEKPEVKDFSHIEEILRKGWKGIYKALDDEHKRAFWRSFVQSIEVEWNKDRKEIKNIIFF